MKVISMCMWRRPDYSKLVLTHLKKCTGSGDYRLVIHLDGPTNPEVLEVCQHISFAPFEIIEAGQHVGCNVSTRNALRRGFELSDYVIHVEDDVTFAKDALRYFEWARQFKEDASLFSIGAWRHPKGWLIEHGPFPDGQEIQSKVSRASTFHIWGWATWRDRWEDMNSHWTDGDDLSLSWDTNLTQYRHSTGRGEILPLVSRAQNIGDLLGTHRGDAILSYWADQNGFEYPTTFQLV